MSNHAEPIVPTILFVADQRHPWKLATLDRFAVAYHTPTTVRTRDTGTLQQHHVYCIADDADWEIVKATHAALQQQLDDLAAGLRELGSYAKRLADAGGTRTAPNPLTPTVISAPDPDTSDAGSWFTSRLVPTVTRVALTSHTPKMLRRPWANGQNELITFAQRDHFVCPDDAAWERIERQAQNAQDAAQAWERLLRSLGTYSEALGDGRYAKKEQPMQPSMPATEPAAALTTTSTVLVGVAMMDQAEARQTVEQIKTHLDSARRQLLDLYEREGWRALGYSSWRECAAAEFGQSSAQIYRLLSAAQIEQSIDSPIGEIPEAHLRALGKLDTPKEQRAALNRADQLAGAGQRTAKHVEQAAAEINTPDLPPEFAIVQRRFAAHGWKLIRHGVWYKLSQPDGTLHNTYPTLEAHAATLEVLDRAAARQGAPASATPINAQVAPEPWPLPPPGWRWRRNGVVCQLIDNADDWATGNYNGPERALAEAERRMLSRAAESLGIARPAAFTRPRRPVSADVSAQMRYLDQLEAYTTALEQRIAELEQQLARSPMESAVTR